MKDFLLIVNKNCITYKEFFPFIKDCIVNIGYTHPGDFDQPEEDTHKSMQGLTRWFTTLSTSGKPPLVLTATYDPEKHKHYDNYDAINVDKVKDIPWDYDGVIGCPITILDHNLDNVEIVRFRKGDDGKDLRIGGKDKYCRVLIKKKIVIMGEEVIHHNDTKINGKERYRRVCIRLTRVLIRKKQD